MLSPARSVYRWASWASAVCGAHVIAYLLGTLPRTLAELGLLYLLPGYLGIVFWAVAFGTGLLEKVGPRLMLRGHILSGAGMGLVFVWSVAARNMDLLVLVPAAFGIGQLPVLWALLTGHRRGMT
ncbi:hypothetical protein NYP18_03530 [Corynebacterium sp. YIM 101645]|uniref:Uncharacterized protein n=1 Tax=Corynebacterium lemuris TaxID=1859292 RepID=A0ABT2FUA6_9CORY|nr:hypothetical protein [Corynebacterium lemuris]